jgi:hypothetical protein
LEAAYLYWEKGLVKPTLVSMASWFLLVLGLNILDVLLTKPAYEINPVTLYLWGALGILLSAGIKMTLVLVLGVLIVLIKKVATPAEWTVSSKLLHMILMALAAFYVFVVVTNLLLLIA